MKTIGMVFLLTLLTLLTLLPASMLMADEEEEIRQICSLQHNPADYAEYEEYARDYETCILSLIEDIRVDVIEGFTVYTSPTLLSKPDFNFQQLSRILDTVQGYLFMIDHLLPAKAMNALRSSGTSIYIGNRERRSSWHPCPDGSVCYSQNLNQIGIDSLGFGEENYPDTDTHTHRVGGIRVLLHELAHAYHFKVIAGQWNNQCILGAYERNRDLYYDVEYFDTGGFFDGNLGIAFPGQPFFRLMDATYLTTNHQEYFAELTVLYFLSLNHYPYHRVEFFRYDPDSYQLIEEAWFDPEFCQDGP